MFVNREFVSSQLGSVGLEEFTQTFLDQGIDAQAFPNLRESDLLQLGVTKIGQRLKLLKLISGLRATANGDRQEEDQSQRMDSSSSSSSSNTQIPSHFGDIM